MRLPSSHALALWGATALVVLGGVTWWRVSVLSDSIQADTRRLLSIFEDAVKTPLTVTYEGAEIVVEVVTPRLPPGSTEPDTPAEWAQRHRANMDAVRAEFQ